MLQKSCGCAWLCNFCLCAWKAGQCSWQTLLGQPGGVQKHNVLFQMQLPLTVNASRGWLAGYVMEVYIRCWTAGSPKGVSKKSLERWITPTRFQYKVTSAPITRVHAFIAVFKTLMCFALQHRGNPFQPTAVPCRLKGPPTAVCTF